MTASGTSIGGILTFAEPATILRCRGFCQASFDATMQVGDSIDVTWGLGIVSADAAAVGASAVPDPETDPEYPWLWWDSMQLRSNLAAGVNAWGLSAQRIDIDTKAMRWVKPQQALLLVAQIGTIAGAPVTDLEFGNIRVLVGT